MTKPTIKRIHVNQHVIKSNNKNDLRDAVFTVKNKGRTIICDSVSIDGPSTLVYSPDKPLSCGAHVWIESIATVRTMKNKVSGTDVEVLV